MKREKTSHLKHEIDGDNLYLMETFTDFQTATIQRFTPMKKDGSPDQGRGPLFRGYLQVMSPKGPIPVSALLEAETLEQAVANYPGKMNQAFEDIVARLQEKQRGMHEKQREMQSLLRDKSKGLAACVIS